MSLRVGTCLGPYEVTAQIGAGGMGEVYRARDTKLDRSVALKILPQSFAQDAERLARFEREAKTLASLNHPNIAIIHGFEEADGIKALVMELVEGPTLADRIAQGPIPVEEALPIAKQIAEALEAAHEQGTIHRDLKPANVIVRPDGTVKVLDFGLAKAIADEAGTDLANSPTVTAMATSAGVLLGTAAYMSPEQARGKAVDKRTDIWAFGCVLFELLTGRRAFEGATIAETLAHVLERDPDWTAIPITTPLSVTRLLRRCLEKDHKRRLRDIGDARIEIDDVARASAPLDQRGQTTTAHVSQSARSLFPWLAAAATLAAVILAVLYVRKALLEPTLPRAVTRQTIAVPGPDFLDPRSPIAMSPDGLRLVYRTGGSSPRLSLQSLDRFEPAPIPGTEGGTSPSSRQAVTGWDFSRIAANSRKSLSRAERHRPSAIYLPDPRVRIGMLMATSVARARSAASRAQAAMPQFFGRVPKTAVIVTPVAAVEEPTTADRYQRGTIDGKRPGEYQINAGRWLGQRRSDLEAVVFHETIPGHHLEISLSLERPDAHLVTKLTGNTAFTEGWGLYAERLADEMKLYSSDVDRLGMWQSRAYRAARLVVDTGLHAFGWPREKAIGFMTALHLASGEEIASEVDRYIIWPGQATAYMTGALEIERLRAGVQQRLGSRFDIRAFHDAVLGDGPVPLPMLRQKLEKLR